MPSARADADGVMIILSVYQSVMPFCSLTGTAYIKQEKYHLVGVIGAILFPVFRPGGLFLRMSF